MSIKRRDFLKLSAASGLAISTGPLLSACYAAPVEPRRIGPNDKFNILCVGVAGSIGRHDLKAVATHPRAHIAGLCDIDTENLGRAGDTYKDAFQAKDYREVFAKHIDKFDGVICATPDHTHCAIDTLALSKGKHTYGQKPLVQQLEELSILRDMVQAHPNLSTQMGNQRMKSPGRRAAVHILKSGTLGKCKEIFATTGSSLKGGGRFFNDRVNYPVQEPPAHLDWDLWQAGVQPQIGYRKDIHPFKWRSMWDYGTGALGDWGCHLLDVIFYSYPELTSPAAVKAQAVDPPKGLFHARTCKAVLTYNTTTDAFAGDTVKVHYADQGQIATHRELNLPKGTKSTRNKNQTCFVCEGGTLILTAGGGLQIWRDGKSEDWKTMAGMPEFKPFNHRHEWVNTALGEHNPDLHWSPFSVGLKITEGALLSVKATKYPGKELKWDSKNLKFTNHDQATKTIVRRDYRKGFEPVRA